MTHETTVGPSVLERRPFKMSCSCGTEGYARTKDAAERLGQHHVATAPAPARIAAVSPAVDIGLEFGARR